MNLVKKLLLFSSFSIYVFIASNSFALDKANLTVETIIIFANTLNISEYLS